MSIYLMDDGTLDTVLRCSNCGQEMRYNFNVDPADIDTFDYAAFVEWAIEDATADHECTENSHE